MRPNTFAALRHLLPGAMLIALVACGDTTEHPVAPDSTGASSTTAASSSSNSAVKFWDANASANWYERATSLASRRAVSVGRMYTYLSLAQLRAAQDADRIRPKSPVNAAIGSASAVVLTAFFPADAAEIAAALAAQKEAGPWPGNKHQDWALGASIGSNAAARVMAYAAGDLFGAANPGLPPIGPGYWIYLGGPMARGGFGARPIFLSSGDEFRSPPPPTFGSPAFVAALAEVRLISDTRTPEQLAIAQYWNANQSPTSNAALGNIAVELLRRYRRSEAESARILFLMNAAIFDATIACFNTKYTYWFIRPPQADPGISLPIGLPPHPSYPSAHSCNSGSGTEILALTFPAERTRLESMATEASLSRLYGGIHYRFDMEAGLELGRSVARKAWHADLNNVAVR